MKIREKKNSLWIICVMHVLSVVLIAGMLVTIVCKSIVFSYPDVYGKKNPDAIEVSLTELLENPEAYNRKLVRVKGVSFVEFEHYALYDSKESVSQGVLDKKVVWLNVKTNLMGVSYHDIRKAHKKHIVVEGVYNMNNRGHLTIYNGAIEDISRIEIVRKMQEAN